jgi:hypothetical protein
MATGRDMGHPVVAHHPRCANRQNAVGRRPLPGLWDEHRARESRNRTASPRVPAQLEAPTGPTPDQKPEAVRRQVEWPDQREAPTRSANASPFETSFGWAGTLWQLPR